jgi:hypothetical protein
MRRGITVLKQAVGIAARAANKSEVSPLCAAAVAAELHDVKAGGDQWWLRTR